MSKPLEAYAMIGNGRTAALVANDGSIDWLCWPRFDSDACFAALLGHDENGSWSLCPKDPAARMTRRYRDGTLVLDTEFETPTGAIRLTDFMPPADDMGSTLIRMVEGLRGSVEMAHRLALRFDYGNVVPRLSRTDDGVDAVIGPDRATLRAKVPLDLADADVNAAFVVAAGEVASFQLQYGLSYRDRPKPVDADRALALTEQDGRKWIEQFDKPTDWPDAVRRSLLTLRALIHQPTGGLVAAATMGLPERPGGSLNWDYRYCWLRDSTFSLTCLLNAGYVAEAHAWMAWLLRAIGDRPDKMQIMYRVDGGRRMDERRADWLLGYEGARPVRIGNAAAGQRQLDVWGEVLDSAHMAQNAGIRPDPEASAVERDLVRQVESIWRQPDHGMWESRGEPKHYVYSKVMAWVAVDRFLKLASSDDGRHADLSRLREEMHQEICEKGFDRRLGSFVGHYGAQEVDASLLLLPLVGFLPIDDPKVTGTIGAIEGSLLEGGLVRRHPAKGGDEEGVFLACSCWLADCMGMQGRSKEARALLERVLALRNDVGLLSEEYHVPQRRLLGNFPQALTHLAVVNTALGLCGPVLQRGGG